MKYFSSRHFWWVGKSLVLAGIMGTSFIETCGQAGLADWSTRYERYQATWTRTSVQLIFNQNKYAAGDTAYFKTYFLKDDFQPVPGKQILELNLVDEKGASRMHQIFGVLDGMGANQIILPDTLSAGIYFVTVYSSWMKNFDPGFLLKKEIIVVDKTKIEPARNGFLKVAVEGGHLINGMKAKICVRTNQPGGTVRLIENGTLVSQITVDNNGMATFQFTPKDGSYTIGLAGDVHTAALPAVEEDGVGLSLKNLKVVVSCARSSKHRNEPLSLILTTRGKIFYSSSFKISHDSTTLPLPAEKLPEGIVHLSILDPSGRLTANRDFYHSTGSTASAKITLPKNSYQIREKVKLVISVSGPDGQPSMGEFAISTTNASLFENKTNTLLKNMYLFSQIRGTPTPDFSDSTNNLDNFLILETVPEPWDKILSNKELLPKYSFTTKIQKTGLVAYSETLEPVPDFTEVMFYFQRNTKSYQAVATGNGKLVLTVLDFYGKDELFFFGQIGETTIPDLKVRWTPDDPISLPHAPEFKAMATPDPYASFNAKARFIERSYGFYTAPQSSEVFNSKVATTDFEKLIGGADIKVNVQQYIIFPTMAELLKEVVSQLRARTTDGKTYVRVVLPEPMKLTTEDPVYLIDGIATKNTAFFLSLKPADLLSIKVVWDPHKLIPLGLMGKYGVVIVQTKSGDVREPNYDMNRLLEGLSQPLPFKSRDYTDPKNQNIPDFRSTMYWNPMVKTDEGGRAVVEFYTTDDVGPFKIRIDGLTKQGEPFSAETEFTVTEAEQN